MSFDTSFRILAMVNWLEQLRSLGVFNDSNIYFDRLIERLKANYDKASKSD